MRQEEILEGLRAVFREHLELGSPIELETDLFRDLELDSLKQLTLVVEVENRFRLCFERGEEAGLRTVGDLVRLIEQRLRSGARD